MNFRRNRTRESVLLVAAVVGFQLVFTAVGRAQARGAACDRTCLTGIMTTYLKGMAAHTPAVVTACRQCDGVREHQAHGARCQSVADRE